MCKFQVNIEKLNCVTSRFPNVIIINMNFRHEFDMEGNPKTRESSQGLDALMEEKTETPKKSDENNNFGLR